MAIDEMRVTFNDLAEVRELIEAAYEFVDVVDAMTEAGETVLDDQAELETLDTTFRRFQNALHALPRPEQSPAIQANPRLANPVRL